MELNMKGKTALVTGAGAGIGRSIARAFGEEGAVVIVSDISEKGGNETVSLIMESGGESVFRYCDVSRKEDVQALIDWIVQDFGRLDYACNNAGIHNPDREYLLETDDDMWDRIIAINLKGVFLCMKYEIEAMLKQRSGAIVNMSSLSGFLGESGSYAYSAAKHGVLGLTKTAAFDFAKTGIRINAVCPAAVDTPGLAEAPQELRKKFVESIPAGRLGKPEEIAAAVLWLCSDQASFVTGTGLVIDGAASTI